MLPWRGGVGWVVGEYLGVAIWEYFGFFGLGGGYMGDGVFGFWTD